MDLLAQPQRHPLAHTFRSVLVPSAPACRVTSGAGSGHLQRAARRAARGGATSRDEHRARACVVRRKAERQARHSERLPFTLGAAIPPRPGMRRFYFFENSTDEDGHLTDVLGDDLACTDSFDRQRF